MFVEAHTLVDATRTLEMELVPALVVAIHHDGNNYRTARTGTTGHLWSSTIILTCGGVRNYSLHTVLM